MVMVLAVVLMAVVVVVGRTVDHVAYPGCRGGHLVEVEHAGVDDLVEIDVAVVAGNDLGCRLNGVHNLLDALELGRLDHRGLVEQHNVAELELLDHKVLDVVVGNVAAHECLAGAKLVFHAQGVDHGAYTVETRNAVERHLGPHQPRDGADGLGNGGRLADAAGLDHDIVEALEIHDVLQLLHEIHLEGAAYTAILQCHEAVVVFTHNAALLDERGVDVDLANVVDDDGKFYSLLVAQDAVDKGGLAAAKIAGEQEHRNVLDIHCCDFLLLLYINVDNCRRKDIE